MIRNENLSHRRNKSVCQFCKKLRHTEERCFKKKTCRKCNQVGHIAKFCKDAKTDSLAVDSSTTYDEKIEPAQRTFVKLNISNQPIDFLYDTGSQFSIMTRETYNKLNSKPPLFDIAKSGTGIDGSQFKFDGIAYMNLSFPNEQGPVYTVQYEPILISSHVTCNIFGAKTENHFKTCQRDLENSTITYTTKGTNSLNISVQCYEEKISTTSAFIQVAKKAFINENERKFVKGHVRVQNHISKEKDELFQITDEYLNNESIQVGNYVTSEKLNKYMHIPVSNTSEQSLKLQKGHVIAEIHVLEQTENVQTMAVTHEQEEVKIDNKHLNSTEKEQLNHIVNGYLKKVNIAPVNKSNIPYEHSINLKDDTPISSRPRTLPYAYQNSIYKQIDKLLDEGIIEISDSPYASHIVPVLKKDGTIRLCCDFRALNEKTIPKTFPIQKSEDLLDLKGSEVFTVLDLRSAYWHIPIKEEDQHKTAFVVSNGKYQWTVLPYGLTDAAFSQAYVMNEILKEFDFVKSFFDDCIIAGKRKEHLNQIKKVLETFAEFGIHVNLSKCQFMKEEVTFIGHVVQKTGILPEMSKVKEVIAFPRP